MDAPARSAPGPRALGLVPARLESVRLPRKMLLRETGRYLFEHTVRNAERASLLERVVLATDAPEVLAAAREAGVEALGTSPTHASGTDRIHEAHATLRARGEGPWDVVVNVQGDEPEVPPADLDRLVRAFADPAVELATLYVPTDDPETAEDPNVVKVVLDAHGDALYFSRARVPSPARAAGPVPVLRHLGVYAYRPQALERFCALERGRLERVESLEQLRWLEAGGRIRVLQASRLTVGIDTPEDYALFTERLARDGRPDPRTIEDTRSP